MTPKPLIDVLGAPMVRWAADSLSFFDRIPPADVIAVVREDDVDHYRIDRELARIFPGITVLVDPDPQGAASTVLVARPEIDGDDSLLVMDCDLHFVSPEYEQVVLDPYDIDGALPVFEAEGEKWSFSVVGHDHIIRETAEKRRIAREGCATYANAGFYFFTHGKDFVATADELVARGEKAAGEYYVSLVVGEMVRSGRRFYAAPCDSVHNLGTPDDLRAFLSSREGA